MNAAVRRAIERTLGRSGAGDWQPTGSSGWGEASSLTLEGHRFFVKTAAGRYADMLACEADGLSALRATRAVRVPGVAAVGEAGAVGYLALEWLDLQPPRDPPALAGALARLHRAATPRGPHGERFGWHRDNWIGGTPQANAWCDDWCAFFRDRRVAPQLALAQANGFAALRRDGERLLAAMPVLFRNYAPVPSLVHGDLWSGNAGTLADGAPVVFDPACYVGDREVDVAMAELFGGFPAGFAAAYDDAWPLAPGYEARRDLYDLYHLLNHVNLFGAGYLHRSERTLARVLAACDGR